MHRSPVLTSLALVLGLSLTLTLVWLLDNQPTPTVQAAPTTAIIVVTTTIQAAVDAAQPGDTISIPTGTYTEHVVVNKPLTFLGAGRSSTIVDGSNTGRVFDITSGDVSISDLTVQNGNGADSGGGIRVLGNLVLTNVNVLSNTSGVWGGGAYAYQSTVSGSLFQNNRCTGSICNGGGLYVSGALVVTGAEFLSNTATGSGGGIYARGSLTLVNVNVLSNTAPYSGGGVFAIDAATLSGGRFENNLCDIDCYGGGLFANGALVMTGTQFVSNTAINGGGGAFAVTATLSGGRFENNRCTRNYSCGGGGLIAYSSLTLTGTEFLSNAAYFGGALQLQGGTGGSLVNALFARNSAGGRGSAMYLSSPGIVQVVHATIANPTLSPGPAIYVSTGTVGITNTIIASYTTGIQAAGGVSIGSDYNLFFMAPTAVVTGSHSITGVSPAFVAPGADDYHLAAGSPAIDRAVDAGVYTDLDGNRRPFGPQPDIGAYEWQPYNIYLPMVLRNVP